MNETERDRILRMLADGIIRPNEAAQLLAALADEATPENGKKPEEKAKAKPKEPLMEVQMQRPDGTSYTVQVPPNLFPMVWQITKVAIKESVRNTAQESWAGFKHIVRNKTEEVKTNVKARVSGSKTGETTPRTAGEDQQFEARQRILQMVQNGRLTAQDASRLIQQLDAHQEYQKNHASNVPAVSSR